MDVDAAELGTTVQRRKHLARIEDLIGIEGAFHALLLLELVLREHHRHEIALLDPHPMLAGEHATHFHAELEDLRTEGLGPLELPGPVRIIEDERVEIAVAGVEHVHHAQSEALAHLPHAGEDLGEPPARDRAVHAVVIGRDPADGGKGVLAPGPEPQPLFLARARLDEKGAVLPGDGGDDTDQMLDLRLRPVELADDERLRLARIAGRAEILRRVHGGSVHHLQPRGNDAVRDDRGDAGPGVLDARERHQHGTGTLRFRQDAHRHLGDDAEHALRADHDAEQIISPAVEMLAAEADDLPVRQHEFDAEDVVHGETVFEAVHAARILRHVAADGAGDLRGGIGRVVETRGLDGAGDGEVGDPRLGTDGAVLVVDGEDAIEPGHDEQHAVSERQRTARERGAGASRHHLDAPRATVAQHFRHLARGLGKNRDQRRAAVGGKPVALVGLQRHRIVDDPLAGDDAPQIGGDRLPPTENLRVGLRQLHLHDALHARHQRGQYTPPDCGGEWKRPTRWVGES